MPHLEQAMQADGQGRREGGHQAGRVQEIRGRVQEQCKAGVDRQQRRNLQQVRQILCLYRWIPLQTASLWHICQNL